MNTQRKSFNFRIRILFATLFDEYDEFDTMNSWREKKIEKYRNQLQVKIINCNSGRNDDVITAGKLHRPSTNVKVPPIKAQTFIIEYLQFRSRDHNVESFIIYYYIWSAFIASISSIAG